MAEKSVYKRMKAAGLFEHMGWRTVRALPLIRKHGMGPSVILPMHAYNRPNDIVLTDADGSLTYSEFRERFFRLASGIHASGGVHGDGVMILLANGNPFIETLYACTAGSFTSVYAPLKSTAAELEYLAENSEARWIVLDAKYAQNVAGADLPNIPPERRIVVNGDAPEGWRSYEETIARGEDRMPAPAPSAMEVSTLAYTSGTTGKPKGAKRNVKKAGLPAVLNFLEVVPFHGSDVHLVACPLYHAAPMGLAHTSLVLGASLVIMPRFDPEEALRMIGKHKITTTIMVPTMIHDLLALPEETVKKYDVSSLRIILTTGAPLTLEQRAAVRERFGDVLYDMYGSTEWAWLSVATPQDHIERPGTVGRPVPGNEIRIVDENRQPVARGEIGELYGKTPMQVDEYHRDEEATRESFLDGFLSVGDLVREDPEGYLYLVDRKSDMVISGGVNLYPPEIEAVLLTHPAVADAAVLGVPDERMGEKLLAFIVRQSGAEITEDELTEFTRKQLSGPKTPREYVFLDEIPHNVMGKVLKKDLKQTYLDAKGG